MLALLIGVGPPSWPWAGTRRLCGTVDEAITLQPSDADTLRDSGTTKLAKGKHEEAPQDLDETRRVAPDLGYMMQM